MKIKKGDKVIILVGKDKGKTGKILQVVPEKNRVSVEGLNIQNKHMRPRKQGESGQKIQIPAMIDASNVALISAKDNKATRVGYKKEGEKKVRIDKKSNQAI